MTGYYIRINYKGVNKYVPRWLCLKHQNYKRIGFNTDMPDVGIGLTNQIKHN